MKITRFSRIALCGCLTLAISAVALSLALEPLSLTSPWLTAYAASGLVLLPTLFLIGQTPKQKKATALSRILAKCLAALRTRGNYLSKLRLSTTSLQALRYCAAKTAMFRHRMWATCKGSNKQMAT